MGDNNDGAIVSPLQTVVSMERAALERGVTRTLGSTLERASWDGCRRAGAYLGLAFFAAWRPRRKVAIANVQLALGSNRVQAMRIARRATQNWGMTICEFLHLPGASAREIRDYVRLDGLEHLQSAVQDGSGVIIMTAHLGNWEVLLARLAQEFAITAMVRPLHSAAATEHMTNVRRGVRLGLISKHSGGRPALKLLRGGGALCILPDRHAGPNGALLPFFGRATRFETAPARLAMMSDAPIVPVFGVRRDPWLADGRIRGHVLPPLTVQAKGRAEREAATIEGTRQIIACIENMVRARPDQWTWMLRRWRDDDVPPAVPPAVPQMR